MAGQDCQLQLALAQILRADQHPGGHITSRDQLVLYARQHCLDTTHTQATSQHTAGTLRDDLERIRKLAGLLALQNDAGNREARAFVLGDRLVLAFFRTARQTRIHRRLLLTAQRTFALLLALVFWIGGRRLGLNWPTKANY